MGFGSFGTGGNLANHLGLLLRKAHHSCALIGVHGKPGASTASSSSQNGFKGSPPDKASVSRSFWQRPGTVTRNDRGQARQLFQCGEWRPLAAPVSGDVRKLGTGGHQ